MKEFDKVIGYEEEKLELEKICDIMKHPNISLTTDGGAAAYRHGEDSVSIAAIEIDEAALKSALADPVGEDEYFFFCEEELEELIKKKLEEKRNEKN